MRNKEIRARKKRPDSWRKPQNCQKVRPNCPYLIDKDIEN